MKTQQIVSKLKIQFKESPIKLILIVGLIHGLIYVFMIPPWWHHEEPGHFEYAWLIANRDEVIQRGDYDNNLRREIAISMLASEQDNLYNVKTKNLDDDPIKLGLGAVNPNFPVFHWIVSWPLRLVHNSDVLVQLYVVRLTSLILFVLSLWLTWLGMGEIVAKGHYLRWMVPAFLALLPGYVDNMTAVHDDVIASVAAGLFLWLSLRWLKRGFSPLLLAGWLAALVLCYYARETTRLLIIVAPLVPLLRLLKKKAVLIIGAIVCLVAVIIGMQILTFRDASQWFYIPAQNSPNRIETPQAPYGKYAFSLKRGERSAWKFGQSFSPSTIKTLRKKTLTLGVWIWADQPVQINLPLIQYRTPDGLKKSPSQQIQVGISPVFHTTTFYIPYEAGHTWLIPLPDFPDGSMRIYYDGFALAEGEFSSTPPVFDNNQLDAGVWDGQPFVNLVRNPSAEKAWLSVLALADNLSIKVPHIRGKISLLLATIQDISGFGWYYSIVGSLLFQEFWGRSAAAQVPLIGSFSYTFLRLVFILSLLGAVKRLFKLPSLLLRHDIFFLGSVIIVVWLPVIFRGMSSVFNPIIFVPYARYAFPAFIPTVLLINVGILELLCWVRSRKDLPENFPTLAYWAFIVGLAIYAILSFGGYFYAWVLNSGYLILFVLLISLFYYSLHKISNFMIRFGM